MQSDTKNVIRKAGRAVGRVRIKVSELELSDLSVAEGEKNFAIRK